MTLIQGRLQMLQHLLQWIACLMAMDLSETSDPPANEETSSDRRTTPTPAAGFTPASPAASTPNHDSGTSGTPQLTQGTSARPYYESLTQQSQRIHGTTSLAQRLEARVQIHHFGSTYDPMDRKVHQIIGDGWQAASKHFDNLLDDGAITIQDVASDPDLSYDRTFPNTHIPSDLHGAAYDNFRGGVALAIMKLMTGSLPFRSTEFPLAVRILRGIQSPDGIVLGLTEFIPGLFTNGTEANDRYWCAGIPYEAAYHTIKALANAIHLPEARYFKQALLRTDPCYLIQEGPDSDLESGLSPAIIDQPYLTRTHIGRNAWGIALMLFREDLKYQASFPDLTEPHRSSRNRATGKRAARVNKTRAVDTRTQLPPMEPVGPPNANVAPQTIQIGPPADTAPLDAVTQELLVESYTLEPQLTYQQSQDRPPYPPGIPVPDVVHRREPWTLLRPELPVRTLGVRPSVRPHNVRPPLRLPIDYLTLPNSNTWVRPLRHRMPLGPWAPKTTVQRTPATHDTWALATTSLMMRHPRPPTPTEPATTGSHVNVTSEPADPTPMDTTTSLAETSPPESNPIKTAADDGRTSPASTIPYMLPTTESGSQTCSTDLEVTELLRSYGAENRDPNEDPHPLEIPTPAPRKRNKYRHTSSGTLGYLDFLRLCDQQVNLLPYPWKTPVPEPAPLRPAEPTPDSSVVSDPSDYPSGTVTDPETSESSSTASADETSSDSEYWSAPEDPK
jgi:hypothetical protein